MHAMINSACSDPESLNPRPTPWNVFFQTSNLPTPSYFSGKGVVRAVSEAPSARTRATTFGARSEALLSLVEEALDEGLDPAGATVERSFLQD